MTSNALLAVDQLGVRFGGLRAVDGMSLHLEEGEALALIGPNGAGKSTFVNAVTGYCATSAGTVTFAGESLAGRSAHQRARRGLVRTFQNLELFGSMSVRENLQTAFESSAGQRKAWRGRDRAATIRDLAERLGLTPWLDDQVGSLSYGIRKLTELGRAMVQEPKVLLLDEPAAGLNTEAKQTLVTIVREWRERTGGAYVLIEHDMSLISELADRVIVMELGSLLAEGDYGEVSTNPAVIQAYLGTTD